MPQLIERLDRADPRQAIMAVSRRSSKKVCEPLLLVSSRLLAHGVSRYPTLETRPSSQKWLFPESMMSLAASTSWRSPQGDQTTSAKRNFSAEYALRTGSPRFACKLTDASPRISAAVFSKLVGYHARQQKTGARSYSLAGPTSPGIGYRSGAV